MLPILSLPPLLRLCSRAVRAQVSWGDGAVVQSPVKVSFKNKHLLQREYGHPRENVAAIVCNFNAHD